MLVLEQVESFYGRSRALQDISLQIPKGEITAVLGRNGVGKTTLLKTIMNLTTRMGGRIMLDGMDLSNAPTYRRARSGIAYVPQGRQIIPDFTVRENILMGAFASPSPSSEIPTLVPELFPYLMENLDRAGGLLSGGQQQQLAIARALAARPSILLLDEPTEGIQPNIVEEIQRIILRLNREEAMTIVLVDQNIAFIRQASQSFTILEKGRIVSSGMIPNLNDAAIARHLAV